MIAVEESLAPVGAGVTVNYRLTSGSEFAPPWAGQVATPHFLGRFRVLGEIARGGMGVVVRAYDPTLDRELAVKLLAPNLSPESEAGRRFAQEARVAARLHHPGIIPVYETGCLADGRPYFAMPLVDGRTLAAALAGRPAMRRSLPHWLAAFGRVCTAVGYAHRQGFVHRDLKPANVMVLRDRQVIVMDWGAAAERNAADGRDNADGHWVFGTPAYMAPEQARGHGPADPRADVFGLGAILCEILTGGPPYHGGDPAAVTRRAAASDLGDALDRLAASGVDPEAADVARRCLSPAPADRPADANAVADLAARCLRSSARRIRCKGGWE